MSTDASSSGTSRTKGGGRRRPPKRLRKFKSKPTGYDNDGVEGEEVSPENIATKRRAEEIARNYGKIARRTNSEFADMLKVCDMAEIIGVGDAFTWAGKRYQKYIQCKLDRCFANKEWRRVFYQASREFMEKLGSDHRPVMVNLVSQYEKRRGAFRFDKRMVGKVRVDETIQEAWRSSSGVGSLSLIKRIGAVRQSLSNLGSRPSYAWRSIHFGRTLLEKGLRRDVGSGEDINVLMDKWLFDEVPKAPLRKHVLFDLDLRVCDLICPQTKTWNWGKLEENFFERDLKLILKQKPAMGEKDAYEWEFPDVLTRVFPWVLWMLWKNKIGFVFEGKEFEVEATVEKNQDDVRQWFDVHLPTVNNEETCRRRISKVQKWKAPIASVLKCNIGVAWSTSTKRAGTSWISGDSRGVVELHRRRDFCGVDSLVEAKHLAIVWAIEIMASHKINKVVLEVEAPELVGLTMRPRAWPAFRGFGAEILGVIQRLGEWELQSISREANKCAFLIARSVTKEHRSQSYVA
ncbi:hypothetical protein Bca52824_064715 [Brassica carinata]|uniref:RNase H type-1 domain-containing protein n=1 Tax=Brassica carinata TaxID=52824 RepID=A0A8X7QKA6_BRACI|nr:hypothetical protein Bca52824_064715 [Brassica carinata]